MKPKTKLWLFYICTFSIGYFVAKSKAKKKVQTQDIIQISVANDNKVDLIVKALGGMDNITDIQATINNVKITLKDINIIDQDKIKALGAKGSFLNNNKITILFGDNSKDIANKIQNKIILLSK